MDGSATTQTAATQGGVGNSLEAASDSDQAAEQVAEAPAEAPEEAPDGDGCYRPLGTETGADGTRVETFETREYALSAWGLHLQHGGPVAGLLVRAMERSAPLPGTRISRFAVEILGPIPPSLVRTRAWIERPGRRIALIGAELESRQPDGSWRTVARAWAWRLATQDTAVMARHSDAAAPGRDTPAPHPAGEFGGLPVSWRMGFVTALDWRFIRPLGHPDAPSLAWVRLAHPLVIGEEPTPLESAIAICDVANGVGARLDPRDWIFLNTDLTIHLFEEPVGEWFGIEAETSVGRDGIGMSAATLHGESGPIGRIAQTLLVERRTPDPAGRPTG